ncbi:hypothetical protein QQF64_013275 [Cirrhinus molitorella]|uniref:Dolichol-phosphate mannosyltransferase subunit 3 n=1 Tax=Cirrhinus molitorella TaxID=172907 RepID=A0ABR3LQM6_9TELE
MTKLLEWLLGVSLIGMAWGLVTFDLLDLQLPPQYRELAWPMPVYLLVAFGCYSLATVGYRVATFNDCEDAAKELQAQIKEAKADLKKKGLKIRKSQALLSAPRNENTDLEQHKEVSESSKPSSFQLCFSTGTSGVRELHFLYVSPNGQHWDVKSYSCVLSSTQATVIIVFVSVI